MCICTCSYTIGKHAPRPPIWTTQKQIKVQIVGIFEEIDSFYWPKMQGPPPPPHLDKIQKNSSVFSGNLPLYYSIRYPIGKSQSKNVWLLLASQQQQGCHWVNIAQVLQRWLAESKCKTSHTLSLLMISLIKTSISIDQKKLKRNIIFISIITLIFCLHEPFSA